MFTRPVRIARIRGVDVRLDPSLVVLAALLTWLLLRRFEVAHGTGVAMAVAGSALFFGSILVHELGHAFEAQHRGVGVEGVTLLLFGGVTEMHHESRSPRDEFAIAAVGPYLSLVCAAVAHLANHVATRFLPQEVAVPVAEVALLLAGLNLLLALFNLVPGAPLDGGRVLRAALWAVWRDRNRAVRGAARAGQAFAVVVLGFGLLELTAGLQVAAIGGLWWLLIGVFLFRAATGELRRARMREATEGRTAGEVVVGTATGHAGGDDGRGDHPSLAVDAPFDDLVRAHVDGADRVRLTDGGTTVAVVTEGETARALRGFQRDVRTATGRRRGRAPIGTASRATAPPHGGPTGDGRPGDQPGDGTGGDVGPRLSASRLWRSTFIGASAVALYASVFLVPLPYVRYLPGDPAELSPLIELDGVETGAVDGEASLLTVILDEVTPATAFAAWRDPTQGLNPADAIAPFGGLTPEFYAAQRESFAQQFDVAVAVGAEAAGYEVEIRTTPVVEGVMAGSPADGTLVQGDRILTADGEPLTSAAQLQDLTRSRADGDVLALEVAHGDEEPREVSITLAPIDAQGRAGLGIGVADLVDGVELPFEATLGDTRIGGPSAGLMTAVTVYDLLADEDLIAGRVVVGTGTMGPDGTVGTVGGVGAKVRSAVAVDADIMLLPASQLDEALAADPPDSLELVPVATLEQALDALRT